MACLPDLNCFGTIPCINFYGPEGKHNYSNIIHIWDGKNTGAELLDVRTNPCCTKAIIYIIAYQL